MPCSRKTPNMEKISRPHVWNLALHQIQRLFMAVSARFFFGIWRLKPWHSQKFSAVARKAHGFFTCSSLERLAFSAFFAFSALSPGAPQNMLMLEASRESDRQAQRDRENHRLWLLDNTGLKLSPQPFNLSCFLSDVFFANRHASKQTWPSGIDLQTSFLLGRDTHTQWYSLLIINLYYLYQSHF